MITVIKTENAKLGNMGATYRGMQSCPSFCGAFEVCYAKFGAVRFQFSRATRKYRKQEGNKLIEWLKETPSNFVLRHLVSGDLTLKDKVDWHFVKSLIKAHKVRPDVIGFGYTHAWKLFKKNPFLGLKRLVFNASCDSVSEIKQAKKKGFDTVVIVPENVPHGYTDYKGERILICPNQAATKLIKNGKACLPITCDKCMLCAKQNRNYTIAFWVHGAAKAKFEFDK